MLWTLARAKIASPEETRRRASLRASCPITGGVIRLLYYRAGLFPSVPVSLIKKKKHL